MSRPLFHNLALILIVLLTILAGTSTARSLKWESDATQIVRGTSALYTRYEAFKATFGAPEQDAVLAIFADDLAASLSDLEDLLLDLQLGDGVAGVLSVFSLPRDGEDTPFLSSDAAGALDPQIRLDTLLNGSRLAREILSSDRSMTLVTVLPDPSIPGDVWRAGLRETLGWAAPSLQVVEIGLAAVNRDIGETLEKDQIKLAALAISACLILTGLLFRSVPAALICGLPPVFGLIWCLGLVSASGIALDPLLAVIPTLLIVLGFADSVHTYHAIARIRDHEPLATAVPRGVRETLPAVILTSVTTAIAFLSMLVVGSPTLTKLAILGALGLAVQLAAVVIGVAVLCYVFGISKVRPVGFLAIRGWAARLLGARRRVAGASVVLMLVLGAVQFQAEPSFEVTEHMSRSSDLRAILDRVEQALPGVDRLFVRVAAADPQIGVQDADNTRLRAAALALYGAEAETANFRAMPENHALSRRFAAQDGSAYALPVTIPLSGEGQSLIDYADDLSQRLAVAGLQDVTQITGYSLVSATEVPRLVLEIGWSFYIAVIAVTGLAIILMRSVRVALATLVPNLIPIFAVGTGLVLSGTSMTMTGAVALTIAFGIAVDNTIHLLNRVRLAWRSGEHDNDTALKRALAETAPPVIMTTILLGAGFAMTFFSDLPSIGTFGMLVSAAVFLAMLADLFLFPSLIAVVERNRKPLSPPPTD